MRWSPALALAAALGSGLLAEPALSAAGPARDPKARKAEVPGLELDRGGVLALTSLPDVVSRAEVSKHLTTGLTSSLAIQVTVTDSRGRRAAGGGRVDVRYETWDDVYEVTAKGFDGTSRSDSLPSPVRLAAWWRGLRLPVMATGGLDRSGPWRVQVRVSLIPFSEAEERDAQRWFSESVQKSGSRELSASADEASEGLSGVLDLLVATSIKRRSLVRYDWTVTFRPSAQ